VVLWVAPTQSQAQNLYIANQGNAKIEEYNAVTGASVATPLIANTQTNQPTALALSGNDLFVGEGLYIGEYNATTGALLNRTFASFYDAQLLAVGNGNLYAATISYPEIGEFNLSTGSEESSNLTGFLPGGAYALAVSGTNLYVAEYASNTSWVSDYNAITGALITGTVAAVSGQVACMALSGSDLYLAYDGSALSWEEVNLLTDTVVPGFTTPNGFETPVGMAVSGTNIYTTSENDTIDEYSATSGALENSNFITSSLYQAGPIIVSPVPEPTALPLMLAGLMIVAGVQHFRKARQS
jgi:hypothetical protein